MKAVITLKEIVDAGVRKVYRVQVGGIKTDYRVINDLGTYELYSRTQKLLFNSRNELINYLQENLVISFAMPSYASELTDYNNALLDYKDVE